MCHLAAYSFALARMIRTLAEGLVGRKITHASIYEPESCRSKPQRWLAALFNCEIFG